MQPNGRSRWHSSPHTIGRSSEKSQGRAAAASTPTKQSYSDHTPKNRTIQRTRRGGMALEGISSQDRAWSTTFWTLSLSLTHSLTHFLSINLSSFSRGSFRCFMHSFPQTQSTRSIRVSIACELLCCWQARPGRARLWRANGLERTNIGRAQPHELLQKD